VLHITELNQKVSHAMIMQKQASKSISDTTKYLRHVSVLNYIEAQDLQNNNVILTEMKFELKVEVQTLNS
jgi:methyl-accepting chemotaxis protein